MEMTSIISGDSEELESKNISISCPVFEKIFSCQIQTTMKRHLKTHHCDYYQ